MANRSSRADRSHSACGDVVDGKVLLSLKGHKSAVRSVAFAPDGKSIASGSEDRTVKLWDAENGKETHTFTDLPDMVTAVRFSPKGQTLVAATFQGPIQLLDPITKRVRQIFALTTSRSRPLCLLTMAIHHLGFAGSHDPAVVCCEDSACATRANAGWKAWHRNCCCGCTQWEHGGTRKCRWYDRGLETEDGQPSSLRDKPSRVALPKWPSGWNADASIGKDNAIVVGSLMSPETWKAEGSLPRSAHRTVSVWRLLKARTS